MIERKKRKTVINRPGWFRKRSVYAKSYGHILFIFGVSNKKNLGKKNKKKINKLKGKNFLVFFYANLLLRFQVVVKLCGALRNNGQWLEQDYKYFVVVVVVNIV